MSKQMVFGEAYAPCCSFTNGECCCGTDERILRGYIAGYPKLQPMNAEQRAWCLSEIDSVEGYVSKEYALAPDAELARTVLDAWRDLLSR